MSKSRLASLIVIAALAASACSAAPAATSQPTAAPTAAPATTAPTAAPATAAPATAAPATAAPTAAPATAAPTAAATQAPTTSGTLTIYRPGGLTPIWHPNARETGVQNIIFELIFSNLLDNCWDGPTLKLCGDLAESWETTDSQTYTFHLRKDVKWHDGTPFTARDVAFTINRSYLNVIRYSNQVWDPVQGAEEVKAGTAETASGVEVVDDYTIKITTAFPDSSWLNELSEPYGSIVPEHLLKDTDPKDSETTEYSTSKPIGTGPYKFVRYEPDQFIELQANLDFFRGAPSIGQVFYRLLGPDVAIAQLEAGELDLAVEINPANLERLSAVPTLDVISSPGVGNAGLFFNLKNVPSALTRRAIGHAIDVQGIVDAVYGGAARLNRGVHPGMPAGDGVLYVDYDPAVAQSLLQESGWDTSKPFRIAYDPGYPGVTDWAPVMQQQLEAIGMTVELLPIESTAFLDFWNEVDEWDVVLTFGGDQGVNPLRTRIQYQCTATTPAYFLARQTNCQIDELFTQARQEPDEAKRLAIFQSITKLMSEEADWVSLFTLNVLSAKVKGLNGVVIPPNAREFGVGSERWTLTP